MPARHGPPPDPPILPERDPYAPGVRACTRARSDVQFGVAPDQITTELLELCEQFLRHASPIVHTELSQFLAEHGQHGGLGWFLDALGFTTLAHRPAATATDRGLPWR